MNVAETGSQQRRSRGTLGPEGRVFIVTTHAVLLQLPWPGPHVLCPPSLPTPHPGRLSPGTAHPRVHALRFSEVLTENRKRRKQNIDPGPGSSAAAASLPGHRPWWAAQPRSTDVPFCLLPFQAQR